MNKNNQLFIGQLKFNVNVDQKLQEAIWIRDNLQYVTKTYKYIN